MPYADLQKRLEYHRQYYYKNKSYFLIQRRNNAHKARWLNRDFMYSIKNRPCMDCQGWYNPWQIEFDHRPGTNKLFTIGNTKSREFSRKKLIEEIKKCDVVCTNCHKDRTYKRQQISNPNSATSKWRKTTA